MEAIKPLNGLHIAGKRWFRKSTGNTYTSVQIFANGEQLAYLPHQGGYGDHYITLALDWLEANGYIKREHFRNGASEDGTFYVREHLHGTYSVTDVARKKDL